MTRLLAAFLILCAQVFAVLAPGTVVVCVHADGTSAIEFVGSLCCDEDHEEEVAGSSDVDEERGPLIRPGGDDCRDIPFKQDQTTIARTSVERSSEAPQQLRTVVSQMFVACTAPERFVLFRSVPHEVRPRPPEPRLRRPCVVFLRC